MTALTVTPRKKSHAQERERGRKTFLERFRESQKRNQAKAKEGSRFAENQKSAKPGPHNTDNVKGGILTDPKAKSEKSRIRVKQVSNEHNMLTHFPKDPHCDICNSCKIQKARCGNKRHGEPDDLPKPLKFADCVTADHLEMRMHRAKATRSHSSSLIGLLTGCKATPPSKSQLRKLSPLFKGSSVHRFGLNTLSLIHI